MLIKYIVLLFIIDNILILKPIKLINFLTHLISFMINIFVKDVYLVSVIQKDNKLYIVD